MPAPKSLASFPTRTKSAFDPEAYGYDVRQQVAKTSEYEGDVGIEIELEGTGLPATVNVNVNGVTWVSHNDGSLRGGIEYVTSKPCARADAKPLLDGLFAEIARRGGVINNSTRCSTHVHLNARGMKLNQLCAFVALYGCFETTLTNWCEPIRRGNLFALRLEDSDYAVDEWVNCFRTGSFEWSNEMRYLALNPAALMKFGSLEVRTLGGVTSGDVVIEWADALLRLRELACSTEYHDPSAIASDLSGLGGRGFFDKVFGGLAIADGLVAASGESIEYDVRDGFRRIQPIIYSVAWAHALPEILKVYIPNPFSAERKRKKKTTFADITLAPRWADAPRETEEDNE